jgi:hypothetical protein
MEKKGGPIETKRFAIDGEAVSCVGGQSVESELHLPHKTALVSWTCRSTGRLQIIALADKSELPEVWEIVTHIQR